MKKIKNIVITLCILFSLTVNASAASSTVLFEYNPQPITDVEIPNTDFSINAIWDFFSPELIPIFGAVMVVVITLTVSIFIIKIKTKKGR